MRDSIYGLLCALMLGIGQMCMFTGYDTQSFIVEPVLHSVHDRQPGLIDAHAGYYGQAVCMITYTLANLAAPWALGLLGSKLTLVVGSSFFTLYLLSFMFVHFVPFYLTAALMGVGFALYYTGNGLYLTEHSSRNTIERNSALTWAVGTTCMIVGGVVMLFTIKPPTEVNANLGNLTGAMNVTTADRDFRDYANSEIRLMYGAFAVVSFMSNLIFVFIPTRPVSNSLAAVNRRMERIGFGEQMLKIGRALVDHRMIKMAPVFCFVSTTTCFWIYVYPTTLAFTAKLSGYVYLPAYYSIVLGFGDMLMGFVIMALSKRIPNFAQMPSLIVGAVLYMVAMVLALVSTPAWSTNTPNDDPTMWLEPSFELALLIALLFGLADNCINTSRTVLCALCMPDQRAQVFSISKFYQSLTASILMFVAPWMSVPMYFGLIAVNGVAALVLYRRVANKTRRIERKITVASKEAAEASVHPAPIRATLGSQDKDLPIIDNS
ncbi:hypothetical protein PRIPAC_77760 [Pristionchus pacificus]|nr:hypothetical protein PRIPAC_77760 [Pristionchus pacificus]